MTVVTIMQSKMITQIEYRQRNVFVHRLLNAFAQMVFLLVLVGVAGWGILVVIPSMYSLYSRNLILGVQSVGWIIAGEIIINWLCTKFVDSRYDSRRNGTDGMTYQKFAASDVNPLPFEKKSTYLISNASIEEMAPVECMTTFYTVWKMCDMCRRPRPPRCHHCSVCNTCILKRDHHCYFVGCCIGYKNLRHFTVFLFWTMLGTIFGTLHMLPYYVIYIYPELDVVALSPIISLKRVVFGQLHIKYFVLPSLGWSVIMYMFVSTYFFIKHMYLIRNGITSYEQRRLMKVFDSRNADDKMKAVFGSCWALNFIVPIHFFTEPKENPLEWPSIKFPEI